MQQMLDNIERLTALTIAKKCSNLETRVQKVMNLMGFEESDSDSPVSSFSGGWKMRIGLGKVLLQEPNILLLDEPSNQ
jgi:ATP-binding cassette subfamily F protein 3